ncbi:MAG: FAD-dependent oxidoreductase [Myxococcota bacterium]
MNVENRVERPRVGIIGAGAAGMSAALLLARHGIDFQILEAASSHGGRIKHVDDFVDFPIALGAEWLTAPARELEAIVDDPRVEITTSLVAYGHGDRLGYYDRALSIEPLGDIGYFNFVDASWLRFFDTYVVPKIASRMAFSTRITELDRSGGVVRLTDARGAVREFDRVLVTAPLRALRDGGIRFVPPLSGAKREAIRGATVWGGIKAFFVFSRRFYPTFLEFSDSDTPTGQRCYYDAAYGRASDVHVLGLFAVGSGAQPYIARSGDALRDHVLAELDHVFGGVASRTYLRHVVQNWDDEPFVQQAYLSDHEDPRVPRALWEPLDERVFFAGEAYTRHGDWGGVDDATRAARDAVARLLVGLR